MDSYQEIVYGQHRQLTELVEKNSKFRIEEMRTIEKSELPDFQKKRLLEDAMKAHESYAQALSDSLEALATTYSVSRTSLLPERREYLLLMSNTLKYFSRD
ncbi:MAG: hypothetical protein WCI72_03000 [archaeon]